MTYCVTCNTQNGHKPTCPLATENLQTRVEQLETLVWDILESAKTSDVRDLADTFQARLARIMGR